MLLRSGCAGHGLWGLGSISCFMFELGGLNGIIDLLVLSGVSESGSL